MRARYVRWARVAAQLNLGHDPVRAGGARGRCARGTREVVRWVRVAVVRFAEGARRAWLHASCLRGRAHLVRARCGAACGADQLPRHIKADVGSVVCITIRLISIGDFDVTNITHKHLLNRV